MFIKKSIKKQQYERNSGVSQRVKMAVETVRSVCRRVSVCVGGGRGMYVTPLAAAGVFLTSV